MTFSDFADLLASSAATAAFRTDLAAYADRQSAGRIVVAPGSPRVKVLRAIAQLLHAEPTLAVDRVSVHAVSGCADYVGTLVATDAEGGEHTFDFEWNCEWKARELGWTDYFGLPDQIRAAQQYGWQCFARWTRIGAPVTQSA